MNSNENGNGNGKVETFADLYPAFEQPCTRKRLAKNTITLYGQTAKKSYLWGDAEGITLQTLISLNVLAYLGGLTCEDDEPYAANTMRAHTRDLRTMLTFAHEYQIIPEPIKVETPNLPQVKNELETLGGRNNDSPVG